MAATAPSPPAIEPSAVFSADQAWAWDGARWQPASREIPIGARLRARLQLLALPLSLIPGLVGPLLLLPAGFVLFVASVVAASAGSAEWAGLFVVAAVVPALAVPLAIMRLALGFGAGAYRHDLTAKTLWRTRGRPALLPLGESVGGWGLRPRLDAGPVRRTLSRLEWAEVDHGAAGAVVFAIRDRAGKAVYELKSVGGQALWFAGVAGLAVAWTVAVSLGSASFVNHLRSAAQDGVAGAVKNVAALAAARPCASGLSTRQCYLIDSTTVTRLEPKSSRGAVTAMCAARVDAGGTFDLATDCGGAPPVGSKVTLRNWDRRVVDINYQGQVIDTVDSPEYGLAVARRSLQAADAFTWVWALAPALYVLLVAGGDVAWWLGAARRHVRYTRPKFRSSGGASPSSVSRPSRPSPL